MRSPNIENLECFKVSLDREELVKFYKENIAEKPYSKDGWHKIFKEGSPLEWCNSGNVEKDNDFFGGIYTFRLEIPDEIIMGTALTKH